MGKKRTKNKSIMRSDQQGFKKANEQHLPTMIEDWTKEHVKQWVTIELKLEEKHGDILFHQDVTGNILKQLEKKDLIEMGLTHGPASHIMNVLKRYSHPDADPSTYAKQALLDEKNSDNTSSSENKDEGKIPEHGPKKSTIVYEPPETTVPPKPIEQGTTNMIQQEKRKNDLPARQTCHPHPFDEFHTSHRYIEHHILHIPETGPLNLIDPVHEFKLFTNTENATEENLKMKFCNEVFRFAGACMNSRTNGTIHLGVRDDPHGEIVGVKIQNKEKYINYFDVMLKRYFGTIGNVADIAEACIRKPRFVEVLQQNSTVSEMFVIEIDVVPKYSSCQTKYFRTKKYNIAEKKWEDFLFIRNGASSKNILSSKVEYKSFKSKLEKLAEDRKEAEEEHGKKQSQIADEGHKLVSLLTGNRNLLDNSYYDWYILVTNKSHPDHREHLNFLEEIKLFAVLEFDPDSEINGAVQAFRKNRAANLHFPKNYQEPGKPVSEIIEDLNLYQQPSWIFCNGRSNLKGEVYHPLSPGLWQQQRAAEVRKLISFVSHPDIMQRGKFLVVFLLLSKVEDPGDPMIEAFCAFYQELKGLDDVLCICIGTQIYECWNSLLQARYIDRDRLADRCISNLSLPMVNGTIQKLKSVTQTTQRLLPSKGSSSTILSKKEEDFMTALEILCENECKDTEIEKNENQFSEFKKSQEENFYRGGKVSWWNFYFSSENYCSAFIKRDAYEKLEQLIMKESQFSKESPAKIINLYHHPGCGGTTLAMHILWELRKKFRCAVLKNKTVDFAEIGRQLTTLITYGTSNRSDYLPVLLLVDDFEEQENVYMLQNAIQSAIANMGILYDSPLVIILNCMRSQNPSESSKNNCLNSVDLKQNLSPKEQRAFEEKLKVIEEQYNNPEDFYAFMIMKKNFDQQYIENVVKNTLKGFDVTSKPAQLISFLALLNSYITESTISVSQCEDFLGISTKKAYWGTEKLEDKMGNCSNIIIQTDVQERGRYKGARISHSLIAIQCLEEFKQTYKLTKSDITLSLLKESLFYNTGIGRDKLQQDVQSMLVTRHRKEHGDDTDTLFSPLIEAIEKEEGNLKVEKVLTAGISTFNQNAVISQALARHFYIKEKNFEEALEWAKKAKKGAPGNSFISDTLGQVFKSKIKHLLDEKTEKSITAGMLKNLLDLAMRASEAFKESQQQTENKDSDKEHFQSTKYRRKYEVYNTSGYLGEIETGLYTIDIILSTPLINEKDKLSRVQIIQFLSGNYDILRVTDEKIEAYRLILKDYDHYLCNLQSNLKEAFDFFGKYFSYLKPKNPEKEIAELKIRVKVEEYFNKYAKIFCHCNSEWLMNTKLSQSLHLENCRKSLEASKADRFPGLLEHLSNHKDTVGKMEDIVKKYKVLLSERSTKPLQKEKLNFIMANIILHCLDPNSKEVQKSLLKLREQLRTVLQSLVPNHQFSEPYFLASLLFWPENIEQLDEDSKQMEKHVNALKKTFNRKYWQMCRSKQPLVLFYLGKGNNLDKFIHKGKIDQSVTTMSKTNTSPRMTDKLSAMWQNGDIWKEENVKKLLLRMTGRAENNIVYVDYGRDDEDFKIPAWPVFLGQLKSGRGTERVSFYLGFSIAGLIACDIKII